MDDQALEFFAWGARSWVCAGSNFAPEAHIACYQGLRCRRRFHQKAAHHVGDDALMRVLEQGGKFVQCIKYGLTGRGIDCGPPRRPLQPLNKDDKRQLDEVIRTMNAASQRFRREMSDLLTKDEYAALAGSRPPRAAFIDGKFRKGSGKKLITVNPAPGDASPRFRAATRKMSICSEKAREAFDQGHWSKMHPSDRKDVLIKLCEADQAQPAGAGRDGEPRQRQAILDCETIDIARNHRYDQMARRAVDKIYDQTAPALGRPHCHDRARTHWGGRRRAALEFPSADAGLENRPALAAGCSVIVKPAEQTSLTALRVAELATRGWPAIWRSCKFCRGLALVWVSHWARIWMWTWSASPARPRQGDGSCAMQQIQQPQEGRPGMRRQNPAWFWMMLKTSICGPEHVVNAAFWNMGENCSANSRLIVHKDVKAPLMERILARLRDWKTGDPLDPQTHLGALIDAEHLKKVKPAT